MDKVILSAFRLGGDVFECVIDGNNLLFRDTSTQMITPVSGLRFSKAGVLKEFPDLKDDVEWKIKALERLKEHIKELNSEKEKLEYVKNELVKFGYEPLFFQRGGFRPQKFRRKI
ncbi:MAG TPA: hypothetical protein ENG87_05800 [Candidatus Pacearchaeota archaeon]|nr:hypothetical protein [Candidatus Pacearchaeota archaeon]HDZ60174.1 hypothetical protein [Candidatus Pacearchaeota archaeon]